MELKHTPAPWVVDDNGIFFDIRDADGVNNIADVCASQHAYDYSNHNKSGVAYANACLIAAAPDLLQVLQLIVSYHDDGNRDLHREDLEMARKAIAKAISQQ